LSTLQKYPYIDEYFLVNAGQRFIIPSIYRYKRIRNRGFVKILKTRHKISVDIQIVFTVYRHCGVKFVPSMHGESVELTPCVALLHRSINRRDVIHNSGSRAYTTYNITTPLEKDTESRPQSTYAQKSW